MEKDFTENDLMKKNLIEKEKLNTLVKNYQKAIHIQDPELFERLWAKKVPVSLISIATLFDGYPAISQDFLIGGIRKTYRSIDLIAENVEIRLINDTTAVILFSYHTECIRREDGTPYGIRGLETQVAVKEDGVWKLQHIHYSKVVN